MAQMTWLLKSVHKLSTRPVVAFNFGAKETPWTPEEFPRAVIIHAKPMNNRAVFNFNKFRAMMLSKVKTGIMIDADELVGPAADRLFPRIKEEINEEYPYPILPVHWMSRDDDPKYPDHPYAVYDFHCRDCPRRTQRWGHAHPTFRYQSLPWIAKWLRKTLDHERVGNESLQWKEDEDVLNMALWDTGASKQWCKFDIPFQSDYLQYLKGSNSFAKFQDAKWYPDGIPFVFYTVHHAVNADETQEIMSSPLIEKYFQNGAPDTPKSLLQMMEKKSPEIMAPLSLLELMSAAAPSELPPPIFYNGKYYNDGKELRAEYPDLPCMI